MLDTQRVVPVVLSLRPGTRPDHLRLVGDRHTYLDFRYIACDLCALPALEYRDSDNLVVRLALPTMAYLAEQRLDSSESLVGRGLPRWQRSGSRERSG